MIENIDIEKAGMDDASEILELQKLAYQSEAALYPGEPIPPLTQTLAEMKNDIAGQLVLKARNGQTIIGSVRGRLSESTCFIGRLIVHPDFQNRGIGTRLMRTLEARFPQAKRFELFTGHKSARNLHLYEKLGYRVFRREKISDSLTLVFLEKTAGIL